MGKEALDWIFVLQLVILVMVVAAGFAYCIEKWRE